MLLILEHLLMLYDTFDLFYGACTFRKVLIGDQVIHVRLNKTLMYMKVMYI